MYEIKDIDNVTFAFPADVRDLMPEYDSKLLEPFWQSTNRHNRIITRWFFQGLENPKFYPKEGVDPEKAIRHIQTILGSFQPKHEHKTAACAFLLAEWFDKVEADNINDIKG